MSGRSYRDDPPSVSCGYVCKNPNSNLIIFCAICKSIFIPLCHNFYSFTFGLYKMITKCLFFQTLPTVFSAGVDLMELYKPDLKRFEIFIDSFFDMIEKLFGADAITAAAINGHTSAAACIISMLCEYRVMVNSRGTISFNDTAVGIVPPKWTTDLIQRNIGVRWMEYVVGTSHKFQPEEALKIGLVDEVATNRTEAINNCKKFIHMADKVPRETRIHTKRALREHYLTDFNRHRKQYLQDYIKIFTNSPNKDLVEHYVLTLKEKKKAK